MYKEYLDFACDIAIYAGKVMMDNYNNSVDFNYKEDKTVVTYVDKTINHYLIEKVKEKYKDHSVSGEEESYNIGSKYVWVCDPLDGTGMYVDHIPTFMFSLALVYDGSPIVAVTYNPTEDKLYTAIKGEGAYCGDKKINVNDKKLGDLGYRSNVNIFENDLIDEISLIKELKNYSKLSSIGSVVRSCMSVATGNFSCDIFPGSEHGNCDMAASYLIVTEAGGKVTNLYGEEQRYDQSIKGTIVTNKVSHEQVLEVVKKYTKRGSSE